MDPPQKLGADPEDGSDLDDDVDQKFKTAGLDFRGDIVPSVKGVPLDGLEGAKRTLLTDGRSLVPAARLDKTPAGTKLLDGDARSDLLSTFLLSKDAGYAIYVEQPLPPGVAASTETGWTLLTSLLTSSALDWQEVAHQGPSARSTRRGQRLEAAGCDGGRPDAPHRGAGACRVRHRAQR